MNKKLKNVAAGLGVTAVVFAAAAEKANAKINPYVSGKASYSIVNQTDTNAKSSDASWASGRHYSDNFSDETKGAFGAKLAAGIELPFDAIHGAIRGEAEWGWNKVKTDSKFTNGANVVPGSPDTPYTTPDWLDGLKNEFTINTFMVNAYYDFNTGIGLTPYAGFGLGAALINSKSDMEGNIATGIGIESVKGKTTNFAWSIGVGVDYDITDNISVGLEYRYTNLGEVEAKGSKDVSGNIFDLTTKHKLAMHDIMLGAKYRF
jgi:outer membrane autotransporter protein